MYITCIEDLPNEILVYIFSFCPFGNGNWYNIMIVSKRWYKCGKLGFDFSIDNNMGLQWACFNSNLEALESHLLHPKVNPTKNNNEVFISACINNKIKVVERLLLHPKINPADNNNQGKTI